MLLSLAEIGALLPQQLTRGSRAYARLLALAIPSLAADDPMIAECRAAVADCDNWEELIIQMLTNLPQVESVARVVFSVLADKVPGHPAARWAAAAVVDLRTAYDAIDDGQRLHLELRRELTSGIVQGWLLSVEDPVHAWSACAIEQHTARRVSLDPARNGPLFHEQRYVLPPALLVTVRD